MTPISDVKAAITAIAEGYPVRGEEDRFVIVENPKYQPDDGSDPYICIDVWEFREWLPS